MAPLSFVLASLAIYWAMWPTTAEVILIIILGLPIYFFYEYKMNWKNTKKQIGGSLWIIVYLILLAAMSFIGSKEFKGMNWIHYPYDFIAIIVLSLIFIKLVLQVTSIVFTSNVLRKSIKNERWFARRSGSSC